MNCKEIQDLLSPYLDQVLTPEEMGLVRQHLAGCEICRQELMRLKRTIRLIHTLEDVPLPINFQHDLHHKLVCAHQEETEETAASFFNRKSSWGKYFSKSHWISVCAAAVLLFFMYTAFSPLFFSREDSDLPAPPSSPQESVKSGEMDQAQNKAKDETNDQKELVQPQESTQTGEKISDDAVKAPKKEKKIASQGTGDNQVTGDSGEKRQNGSQAARGKKGEQVDMAVLQKAAAAPKLIPVPASSQDLTEDASRSMKGFSVAKASGQKGEEIMLQNVYVELEIGAGEYQKVITQINNLPLKIPDGMIIIDADSGEKTQDAEITVSVARDYTEQVLSSLESMGKVLTQNTSGEIKMNTLSFEQPKEETKEEPAYVTIKVVLKENSN
ncbi:anti-sigma factor family protein [Candidatus Formimonas warabiya]|uniref:Anti-sigma-W factor RsiW n=1 Tax=Formimonas warabiya TaxID=1761012 RepID=A0A3G1KML7_FORW1|nr:zf-HC2 domain-containing protein [Candidatus Formimonas warabiya]ATW23697.1 hypothetical protein DCMF_01830 [Candidatus Formimonas warabiya]